jgi:hypothetical protein
MLASFTPVIMVKRWSLSSFFASKDHGCGANLPGIFFLEKSHG